MTTGAHAEEPASGDADAAGPARRALVTGAAGFIGAPLTAALLARGYSVTALDLRSMPAGGNQDLVQLAVDIRDRAGLADAVQGHDVVFHLAANTENRPGIAGQWDDYEITVGGTVALLAALAPDPPAMTVLTSTQLVYGSRAGAADERTSLLRPATSFAAGKAAAEAFLSSYAEQTGAGAAVCRLANVVGPGVRRGVIADLAARLQQDPSRLVVLGDGRQRRSYVHVADCVTALLTAAAAADRGFTAYNVSNTDNVTVAEVAGIVAECCDAKSARIEFTGGSAWQGDATALHPDPGLMLGLGWRPHYSSAEAVRSAASAASAHRHQTPR